MINGIVYRQGVHIGEIAAEDDGDYLGECFVEQDFVKQLLDIESSKSIVLGRTGSGKTAVLNHIESARDDVIRIDPKDVAFSYISNSDIIRFLISIGCDLNLLFQLLWKHIFVKHSIEKYFKDRGNFQAAMDSIFSRDNKARAYIERYQDTFWKENDVVIREVSSQFVDSVTSDLSMSIGSEKLARVRSSASASGSITNSEKADIVSRVKKAVNDYQVRDMAHAIEALNELMDNRQKKFYIIIDDLDLDWVDDILRYRLIQALVETIKNFRKLRSVKVLVSLRSDVYEKAISTIDAEGIQPEKYDGLITTIKWSKDLLREVLNKRIGKMFMHKYSGRKNVGFYDIFPTKIRKSDGFDYLCDRTLLRPRDLIAFVNIVLDRAAAGSTSISQKVISDVEAEYSNQRLEALKTEWQSMHPMVGKYISLLTRLTGKRNIREWVTKERLDDLCLELLEMDGTDQFKDECFSSAKKYSSRENDTNRFEFAANVLSILYKIGAIEIKLSKQETFYASYRNLAVINSSQITEEAAFRVSPMLWRALGVTPNI